MNTRYSLSTDKYLKCQVHFFTAFKKKKALFKYLPNSLYTKGRLQANKLTKLFTYSLFSVLLAPLLPRVLPIKNVSHWKGYKTKQTINNFGCGRCAIKTPMYKGVFQCQVLSTF